MQNLVQTTERAGQTKVNAPKKTATKCCSTGTCELRISIFRNQKINVDCVIKIQSKVPFCRIGGSLNTGNTAKIVVTHAAGYTDGKNKAKTCKLEQDNGQWGAKRI